MHLIFLACGSELLDGIVYMTRGKASEYFALLCKRGGSSRDFQDACRGAKIASEAEQAAGKVIKSGGKKDELRVSVTARIKQAISKCAMIRCHSQFS